MQNFDSRFNPSGTPNCSGTVSPSQCQSSCNVYCICMYDSRMSVCLINGQGSQYCYSQCSGYANCTINGVSCTWWVDNCPVSTT
jgi:hypothetical protein